MSQRLGVELKEKSFVQIAGYKISFEEIKTENNMEILYRIHVADINGRKTIEAEKGRIFTDPENMEHYILKFINGSISEVNRTKFGDEEEDKFFISSFRYLSIHSYVDLPKEYYTKGPDTMTILELGKDIKEKSKAPIQQIENYFKDRERLTKDIEKASKDLSILSKNISKEELMQRAVEFQSKIQALKGDMNRVDQQIQNYRKSLPNYNMMKWNEKFALPLISFVFALMSLSIGMFSARSGRNEGLGIAVIIMLLFYGLKFGSENLIVKQILPPFMEWFPNIFFFVIGTVLLWKKIRE
jgi:lipopolysaccharide export LptBFGC system permease protein LptF